MKVKSAFVSSLIVSLQNMFEGIENKDNKTLEHSCDSWSARYVPGESMMVVVKDRVLIDAMCHEAPALDNILLIEKSLSSEKIKVTVVNSAMVTATFFAIGSAITLAVVAAVNLLRK